METETRNAPSGYLVIVFEVFIRFSDSGLRVLVGSQAKRGRKMFVVV